MSTAFPAPIPGSRSTTAPSPVSRASSAPASSSIMIPNSNQQRSASMMIPNRNQRSNSVDLFKPRDATQVTYHLKELLEEGQINDESIKTAEKILDSAVKDHLFTPMGCSIYSGMNVESLEKYCRAMVERAKAELAKPIFGDLFTDESTIEL